MGGMFSKSNHKDDEIEKLRKDLLECQVKKSKATFKPTTATEKHTTATDTSDQAMLGGSKRKTKSHGKKRLNKTKRGSRK